MHILIKFYILKKKKSINQSLIYCTNCINFSRNISSSYFNILNNLFPFRATLSLVSPSPFISFSFTSPVFVNDEKRRGHLRFRAFPLATILNAPLARKAEQKFASSAQTKFLATERESSPLRSTIVLAVWDYLLRLETSTGENTPEPDCARVHVRVETGKRMDGATTREGRIRARWSARELCVRGLRMDVVVFNLGKVFLLKFF